MPKIQKIRNWKQYNKSLRERGAIIFTFDKNYLSEFYYSGDQKRGGKRVYSAKMYEYLLSIKLFFRLPWRAAMGFAEGILRRVCIDGETAATPDYAHASRECSRLNLKVKPIALGDIKEGMEIAFDSTGVNVYSGSGWHQRKYGKNAVCKKAEQWKKIHVAMDINTMQIVAVSYTDSNVNDCETVEELWGMIEGKIKSVRGDGAYDTEEFRRIIYEDGASALIPPARTSKAQDELKHKPKVMKRHLNERDAMIKDIRRYEDFDEGLKAWKESSGYHKRSKIETCMFRIKRIFGFNLHQKTTRGRVNEVITKMNLLNIFASLGMPRYTE
jgi:transposase